MISDCPGLLTHTASVGSCNDAAIRITPEAQQRRSQLIEASQLDHTTVTTAVHARLAEITPGQVGSHGVSLFVRELSYVDFFLVPVAHAALYGVVKDC